MGRYSHNTGRKASYKVSILAQISVARLVGLCPAEQNGVGSIPSQEICDDSLTYQCFSPSLLLSLPLSLKINT